MREVVERDTGGAPCLFLHGASGDMTPLRSYESDTGDRRPEWPPARLCGAVHPDRHAAAGTGDRLRPYRGFRRPAGPLEPAAQARQHDAEGRRCRTPSCPMSICRPRPSCWRRSKVCTDRPLKERLERRLMVRRDVGDGKSRKVRMTLLPDRRRLSGGRAGRALQRLPEGNPRALPRPCRDGAQHRQWQCRLSGAGRDLRQAGPLSDQDFAVPTRLHGTGDRGHRPNR